MSHVPGTRPRRVGGCRRGSRADALVPLMTLEEKVAQRPRRPAAPRHPSAYATSTKSSSAQPSRWVSRRVLKPAFRVTSARTCRQFSHPELG